jgi:putative pyruvate formate lyase activating enzyme
MARRGRLTPHAMVGSTLNGPYEHCLLCPRSCGVNRLEEREAARRAGAAEATEAAGPGAGARPRGFCGEGARMRLAWAGLHFGEEPPLSEQGGSGTLFFAGCTLKCPFCQNDQLSRGVLGAELSPEELSGLMLELQARGAQNINLVTATQFIPGVVESVRLARDRGLGLPVVWNSSGYERVSALELLEESVEIYLPDCKTLDESLAGRLLGARNYPGAAREAILHMVARRPLQMEGSRMRRGVILRHLVLPGHTRSSRQVLEWFADRLAGRALLSLMFQFTPNPRAQAQAGQGAAEREGRRVPERFVSRREYERVVGWLLELGIEEGYCQEPAGTAGEDGGASWLPDFRRPNPFPPGQAVPVWHCLTPAATARTRPRP